MLQDNILCTMELWLNNLENNSSNKTNLFDIVSTSFFRTIKKKTIGPISGVTNWNSSTVVQST